MCTFIELRNPWGINIKNGLKRIGKNNENIIIFNKFEMSQPFNQLGNEEWKLINQYLLKKFPIKFEEEELTSSNLPSKNRQDKATKQKLRNKIKILMGFLLQKNHSKGKLFGILIKVHTLNQSKKEQNIDRDLLNLIMKLKLLKATISKDQLRQICQQTILNLILGTTV